MSALTAGGPAVFHRWRHLYRSSANVFGTYLVVYFRRGSDGSGTAYTPSILFGSATTPDFSSMDNNLAAVLVQLEQKLLTVPDLKHLCDDPVFVAGVQQGLPHVWFQADTLIRAGVSSSGLNLTICVCYARDEKLPINAKFSSVLSTQLYIT